MKQNLHITFINPNTENEIVQAISGVIAYNLAENNETIKFDYKNMNQSCNQRLQEGSLETCYYHNTNINNFQNSQEIE